MVSVYTGSDKDLCLMPVTVYQSSGLLCAMLQRLSYSEPGFPVLTRYTMYTLFARYDTGFLGACLSPSVATQLLMNRAALAQ